MKVLSLIYLFQLVLANALHSQVPVDFSGAWEGKIVDRIEGKPLSASKLSAELFLKKIADDDYVGHLKIEKKYSSVLKVAATLNQADIPRDFDGTFLVMAKYKPTTKKFNVIMKETITNSDKGLSWCLLDLDLDVNNDISEFEGKYKGCGSNIFVHTVFDGGKASFKRSNSVPSDYIAKFLNSYSNSSLEFRKLTVGGGKNRVRYGASNTFYLSVKNTGTQRRNLVANYDLAFPDKEGRLIKRSKTLSNLYLNSEQTESINVDFDFPFNLECDSISVHAVFTDKDTRKVVKEFTEKLAVEPFLINNITVANNKRTGIIDSYYRMENLPQFAPALSGLISKGDSVSLGWKAIFTAIGRAGFFKDEEESQQLIQEFQRNYEQVARKGSGELVYLISMAKLFSRDASVSAAGKFLLQKAAEGGYGPAMYDYAILQTHSNDAVEKQKGLETLSSLYNKGMKRAAIAIANAHIAPEIKKNKELAFNWYQKVLNVEDPELYESLTKYYFDLKESESDISKAESYAQLASKSGNTNALIYLGINFAAANKSNDEEVEKGLKLIQNAATLGSREAMFILGALLVTDATVGPKRKDVVTGFKWLKQAAEKGHPKAMTMLGYMYVDGQVGEVSQIKSRYWINKAGERGEQTGNIGYARETFTMSNLFQNLDFSPRRLVIVKDGYGREVERYTEGPGPIELLFDSFIDTYQQSKRQKQPFIDGIEFIKTSKGFDIYAGTVSSQAETGLRITTGQLLEITATGFINFGAFAGTRDPSGVAAGGLATTGLGQDLLKMSGNMSGYNITPKFNHGAFIIKIGNEDWIFIGKKRTVYSPFDGNITIAVNDKDYVGNTGYFDFEIKTPTQKDKN